MDTGISVVDGALWVLGWFGVMLLYTFLDVAIWRKVAPQKARLLNVVSIALCMAGFLRLLQTKSNFQIDIVRGISVEGIFLAIICAVAMYFLLDKFLDPVFEGMLPGSEDRYRETLEYLREAPILSFIQVSILAPIMEEILMRGFLLGGLSVSCGKMTALIVSSTLFALMHFNMVQTLSALICGFILGLLYIKTDSVISCIAAHAGYKGYNMISYFTSILRGRDES